MLKRIGLALLLLTVAGCARQPLQPVPVVVTNPVRLQAPVVQSPAAPEPASARMALQAPVSPLGVAVRRMAEQLELGLREQGIRTLPLAIHAFAELEPPHAPGALGREIAEGFFHELQARGFNVIDHQVIPFDTGHSPKLPQVLSDFYREHRVSYVLSGSYSRNSDGVVVQARVLDSVSRQVVATGQAALATADLEGSLPGYDPLSSRRGMIVEQGGVPLR